MNKSREDACLRVLDAKLGSGEGASDEFLLALQGYLHAWIDEIGLELKVRIRRAADEKEEVDE